MVGRVCLKCNKSDHVRLDELPEHDCEYCKAQLKIDPGVEGHRNYCYVCPECNRRWKLADVLPYWDELFPYSGLAANQDIIRS